MRKHNWSLRELYREMEGTPGNPVNKAQQKLDQAVRKAYGMKKSDTDLSFLLELNRKLLREEQEGRTIKGPGLPCEAPNCSEYISDDFVTL